MRKFIYLLLAATILVGCGKRTSQPAGKTEQFNRMSYRLQTENTNVVTLQSLNEKIDFSDKYVSYSGEPVFEIHWDIPDKDSGVNLSNKYTLLFGAECNGHMVSAVYDGKVYYTVTASTDPQIDCILESIDDSSERKLRSMLKNILLFLDGDTIPEQGFELMYGD